MRRATRQICAVNLNLKEVKFDCKFELNLMGKSGCD